LKRADEMSESSLSVLFAGMESRGQVDLRAEGLPEHDIALQRALDLRYVGQSYEIRVDEAAFTAETQRISTDAPLGDLSVSAVGRFVETFHRLHAARYGHSHPDQPVEVVTARVKAIGRAQRIEVIEESEENEDASGASAGTKPVWFERGLRDTALYERTRLRAGNWLHGPAIIFQFDTTTVIPPDWVARVDRFRNLLITKA